MQRATSRPPVPRRRRFDVALPVVLSLCVLLLPPILLPAAGQPAASRPASLPASQSSAETRPADDGGSRTVITETRVVQPGPSLGEWLGRGLRSLFGGPDVPQPRAPGQPEPVTEWKPSVGPPAAQSRPATQEAASRPVEPHSPLATLQADQRHRDEAEALVRRLGSAGEGELADIEQKLAGLGEAVMVPLKLAELSDDFQLRSRAARLSRRLRWRLVCSDALLASHQGLIDTISGTDEAARAALVDQVAKEADSAALGFLGECLADSQIYVRQRAIDGLVAIFQKTEGWYDARKPRTPEQRQVASLLETALGDDDRDIRLLAVGALAKCRTLPIKRMAALLDDPSVEVRITVIQALGYGEDPEAVQFLRSLLTDPQWRIRAAAVEAVGNLSGSEQRSLAGPVLVRLLEDPDPYVRALAIKYLSRWAYTPAADKMLEMVKGGKIPPEIGLPALARLRSAVGLEYMKQLYQEAPDAGRRLELLSAMAGFDPNMEVDKLLLAALKDDGLAARRADLIAIVTDRRSAQEFQGIALPLLTSPDPKLAEAAWEFWRRQSSSEVKVDPKLVEQLLDAKEPALVLRGVQIASRDRSGEQEKVLARMAGHASAEVVLDALNRIFQALFNEPLAATEEYYYRSYFNIGPDEPERRKLAAAYLEPVHKALARAEPAVRVAAAALLYRSKADQGEPVVKALTEGLTSRQENIRGVALTGIVDAPAPFVKTIDLGAALLDKASSNKAAKAILSAGPAPYIDSLLKAAETPLLGSGDLILALLKTNDARAIEAAETRLNKAEEYERRAYIESIVRSDSAAAARLLAHLQARYARAATVQERMARLDVLATFRSSDAVDRLLLAAMTDESMKPARSKIISLLSDRDNTVRFARYILPLLISPDAGQADAAWEFWQRNSYGESKVPASLRDRLLTSDRADLVLRGIAIAARQSDPDASGIVKHFITHESDEVAMAALNQLGLRVLGAQFISTDGYYDRGYDFDPSDEERAPPLNPAYVPPLRKAMQRAEPTVRTAAAAVLYGGDADAGPEVQKVLADALADANPQIRNIALAGILRDPSPFAKAFDFVAALRVEQTSNRAQRAILKLGPARFTDALLAAAGKASLDDRALMTVLLKTGDKRAYDLVLAKVPAADEDDLQGALNALQGAEGPGAVRLLTAAVDKVYNRWALSSLAQVAATLKDPSARDLLVKLSKDERLKDEYVLGAIQRRLMQLAPEAGAGSMRQIFQTGSDEQRRTAVRALLESEKTETNVGLALTALRVAPKLDENQGNYEWFSLIEWLPAEAKVKLLRELGSLQPQLTAALLGLTYDKPAAAAVDALLGSSPRTPELRAHVAAVLGAWTASDAKLRPDLAALRPEALPLALEAAADWQDAPAALEPFLQDKRPDVAEAASRGLALYAIGHPAAALTDGQKAALVQAVAGKEAAAAYLAAEALALAAPDALRAVDPAKIDNDAAAMRQAIAFGNAVPEPLRKRVLALLWPEAEKRAGVLAVISAGRCFDPRYEPALVKLAEQGPEHLQDELIAAAAASGRASFIRPLAVKGRLSPRGGKDLQPIGAALLDQARKDDPALFAGLAHAGWIETPEPGDLLRFLMSFDEKPAASTRPAAEEPRSPPEPWEYMRAPEPPTWALPLTLAWAPAEPDPKIIAMIADNSPRGRLAAAVAAAAWGDAKGRELLLAQATAAKAADVLAPLGRSRNVLALLATPQDVPALVKRLERLQGEAAISRSYGYSSATSSEMDMLQGLLSRWEPETQLKQMKGLASFDRYRARFGSPYDSNGPSVFAVQLMLADRPDWPKAFEQPTAGTRSGGSVLAASLYARLLQARRAAASRPGAEAPEEAPQSRPASEPASLPVIEPDIGVPLEMLPSAPDVDEQEPDGQAPTATSLMPPWYSSRFELVSRVRRLVPDDRPATTALLERIGNAAAVAKLLAGMPTSDKLGPDEIEYMLSRRLAAEPGGREKVRILQELLRFGGSQEGDPPVTPADFDRAAVARALVPLLSAEQQNLRRWAIQLAGELRLREVADDLRKRLAAAPSGDEMVECARAVAALGDAKAAEAIAAAMGRGETMAVRLKLALLLRMMDRDEGRAEVERAVALYRIRVTRFSLCRSEDQEPGPRARDFSRYSGGGPTLSTLLLGDLSVLEVEASDLLEDARRSMPWLMGRRRRPDAESAMSPPRSDLDGMALFADYGLHPPRMDGHDLPVERLIGGNGLLDATLPFAALSGAEQGLEPHFHVQFADRCQTGVELWHAWRAWWRENRDKPREEWWRQAVAQATEELTHAKWWHRMRAVRRLMRLTGRKIEPPENPFDAAAFAALQSQWRAWMKEGRSMRAALLASGIEAGALPAAAAGHAADDAAYLADLVTMAAAPLGSALSDAALVQLETWPDSRALLRQALAWQDSPRTDLARWVNMRWQTWTGKPRLRYSPADEPR